METKILKDSIKAADDGRVEYTMIADNRLYKGFIEESFFMDVLGQQNAPQRQKVELTSRNTMYLEKMSSKQLEQGLREIVIR